MRCITSFIWQGIHRFEQGIHLLVKRLTDVRRTKSEVYEGFSHVFCDDSTQIC
ncbi:hypothetical protein Hanom_Chr13g01182431 [Helianthus anomalus]